MGRPSRPQGPTESLMAPPCVPPRPLTRMRTYVRFLCASTASRSPSTTRTAVDGALKRTPNDQAAGRHGLLHLGSGAMAGAAVERPSRPLGAVAKIAPSFLGRSSAYGFRGPLCTDRSTLSPLCRHLVGSRAVHTRSAHRDRTTVLSLVDWTVSSPSGETPLPGSVPRMRCPNDRARRQG